MSKLFSRNTNGRRPTFVYILSKWLTGSCLYFAVSDVDDVVGEKANKKEPKTSLISTAKKEKKEKKSKEKETRYAHLGDESSGDDEADGK